jgi:Flp pilus assembly protein TadD
MDPRGYHLTNVVLHSASAALLYLLVLRLLGRATTWSAPALSISAAMASLFFSLHPLRAESVAWVTERRDVLSGFFFVLTVLLHLAAIDATGRRRRWLFVAAVGSFVLAFAAKSMVMTLPVVLVLLDFYPLRRLDSRWRLWSTDSRGVWLEKVPYLVVAAAGAMVSYYAQAANAFISSLQKLGPGARPAIVSYGLWFYVSKTAAPMGLSPLYELPERIDPLASRFLARGIAVIVITIALVLLRRRWPAGLTAWLYYAIVLAPVVGIVHSGFQLAHDRYSYLACLSWAVLVGAGAGGVYRLSEKGVLRRSIAMLAGGAAIVWLAGLGFLTWHQVQIWRDTDTLWRYAVESEPECTICENNLGAMLANDGLTSLARERFERALSVKPSAIGVQKNLAMVYANTGDLRRAADFFAKLLQGNPDDVEIRNNLGVTMIGLGRPKDALAQFQLGLALHPMNSTLLANVAMVLAEMGDREQSRLYLKRAYARNPETPGLRFALGLVALNLGERDMAAAEYESLRKDSPYLASILGPGLLVEWQ